MPDLAHRAVVRLDDLLRSSAQRYPERIAIRTADARISFAELDAAASRLARTLARWLPEPGQVVALANVLDPAFAVAYYAVSRAGHVSAVVNPLLPGNGLARALTTSGARVFIAPGRILASLPPSPKHNIRLRPLEEVVDKPGGDGTGVLQHPVRASADTAASIQFTSGTSAEPKAVVLSHRGLAVNADQMASAHGLSAASVTLNHLPTYHPMHLNSAVGAASMQVLCDEPDSARAIIMANRYRATHYYSIPVRLARLAVDPRLPRLELTTVSSVLSGGSALPPGVAQALAEHFDVAVAQGYGLAEMSPLTHCDSPFHPTPGSVGQVVEGTECRIVDVQSGTPLPTAERGEIQVRGPQRMIGYLNNEVTMAGDAQDPQDWLATGDIGYQGAEGRLFVVDRIKDVFKCDNWLVAPSEIESVLGEHPGVRDCVVVDVPERFRGAVAGAVLVVHQETTADEVIGWANKRLPDFQRLHRVVQADRIDRSPNGKVRRRDFRALVASAPELESTQEEQWQPSSTN